MYRNLIQPREGVDVGINVRSDEYCGRQTATVVQGIANGMEITRTNDAPRMPTILSPAFAFHANLFPTRAFGAGADRRPELAVAQLEAKRQFRGIAAVLILRELLGLKIELAEFATQGAQDGYSACLAMLYTTARGFKGANNQPNWWTESLRYLRARTVTGVDLGPLCLLSPYTLFFPPVQGFRGDKSVFWHKPATGQWFDPTSDWRAAGDPEISYRQQPGDQQQHDRMETQRVRYIRGAIKAWLDQALPTLENNVADTVLIQLTGYCNSGSQATAIKNLLLDWKAELGRLAATEFVSLRCNLKSGSLFPVGIANGTPIVDCCIDSRPTANAAPMPILNEERLFLDRIYLLSDAPISSKWRALSTSTSDGARYWLFPFTKEGFESLDARQFFSENPPVRAELLDGGGIRVTVSTIAGSLKAEYPPVKQIKDAAESALELRLWPNFALPRDHNAVPPDARDYLLRVKQKEQWNLEVHGVFENGSGLSARLETAVLDDSKSVSGWDGTHTYRRAKFYKMPGGNAAKSALQTPRGLYFKRRPGVADNPNSGVEGLVLMALDRPDEGGGVGGVRLGIDFGTSNTSICMKPMGVSGQQNVVRFASQTLVLRDEPFYPANFAKGDEGAAALADFPYNYGNEDHLTSTTYFPTQIILYGNQVPDAQQFQIRKGLILPRNVVMDNLDIPQLLADYPLNGARDDRPYRLITDLKWRNRVHRPAFLEHLMKMVIYEAARMPNRVVSVNFSYPKAFSVNAIEEYKRECERTFRDKGAVSIQFISESEAVLYRCMALDVAGGNNHLIMDIGGGTTDLLFIRAAAAGAARQTSYALAGRYMNNFFGASNEFRRWFCARVIQHTNGEARKFLDARARTFLERLGNNVQDANRSYLDHCFFGLLSHITGDYRAVCQSVFNPEGNHDDHTPALRKSLRGFFYTVTVFFGAMAYLSGQLLRTQFADLQNLKIDVIGNGSKFRSFMPEDAFAEFMNRMFAEGYGSAVRIEWNKPAEAENSKAWVAEGLALYDPAAPPRRPEALEWEGWFQDVETLASAAAETEPEKNRDSAGGEEKKAGKTEKKAAENAAGTSIAQTKNPAVERIVKKYRQELEQFLAALGRSMPDGRIRGSAIVPFVEGDVTNELRECLPDIMDPLKTALINAASVTKRDLKAADSVANADEKRLRLADAKSREPGPVVAIQCLLDRIRVNYAQ